MTTATLGRDYVCALDIGGTSFKSALVDGEGIELNSVRIPTPRGVAPAVAVDAIVSAAVETVERGVELVGAPPVALGAAVLGLVDEDAGVARLSAALGWRDVPLRQLLQEATGVPVVIGHDLRTAAIGEAALGAAKGIRSFLFIAIGTGVGAAVVVDGQPLSGGRGCAGEFGHIPLYTLDDSLRATACGCGAHGCLETEGSAAALERSYCFATGQAATAEQIAAAALAGDEAATKSWQHVVQVLARGLVASCALVDPELIVVGGGLALAGEQLLAPLRTALRGGYRLAEPPPLVPSQLGDRAACLGAGVLAWRCAATCGQAT